MPKPLTKPAVLRESWRPHNVAQLRAQKQQLAVRLTFTTLLASLVACALYLTFAPLFHPITKLFFLTAGASNAPGSAPIAYFQDDALRFLTSTGSLSPTDAASHLLFMETPDAFRSAIERVTATVTQATDIAIVHIAARPLLINQRPYLRCDNFDSERPLEGAVPCEELFDQLGSLSTGHVLALLDVGAPTDQEALSFDDVLFFDQLDDLATAHAGPNYSIILSHSVGEQSYHSTSLQCSVFALAASLGLSGLADLDDDRKVTNDEFVRFVAGTTNSIVQKESGSAASQHPRQLIGQLDSSSRLADLVIGSAPSKGANKLAKQYGLKVDANKVAPSVPVIPSPAVAKNAEGESEKAEQQTFKSSLTEFVSRKSDDIGDDLRNELNLLVIGLPKPLARGLRRSVDEAQKMSEKDEGKSTAEDSPKKDAAADDASNPTPAATEDPNQPAKPGDSGAVIYAPGFPDLSQMSDSNAAGLLRTAWEVTAYLERTDQSKPRPMDLAPVPWLNWRNHLHAIEERIRTAAMIDEAQVRLELTSEILGGYQLAHGKAVTIGTCMKSISQEIAPLAIQLSSIDSFGAAKNLQHFGLLTVPADIDKANDDFNQCLMSDSSEALDKWLKESAPNEVNHFIEVFYSRLLLREPAISWTVAQALLKARRDYELCVHHPLLNHAALGSAMSTAQRHLLQATREALDHIGDWNSSSSQALAQAQAELADVERRLRVYVEAWQWRNQMLMDVPALIAWLDIDNQRLGSTSFDQTELGKATQKELPLLIDDMSALAEACKTRESTPADAVEGLLRRAQNRYGMIRRSWLTVYEGLQARNNDSKTMMSSEAWVVDALLASTLVIGPERNQLLRWRLEAAKLPELSVPTSAKSSALLTDSSKSARLRAELLSKLVRMGNMSVPEIEEPWAFSAAFSQLRVAVPSLIANSANQDLNGRIQTLRQADLLQRLSWQSSKLSEDSRALNRDLWRAEFANIWRSYHQNSAWVLEDALQEELRFWPDLQLHLNQVESTLSGQNVPVDVRGNQIVGSGTSSLSLVTSPEASGRIVWKNAGPDIGNIWLVVDYDHRNLELMVDTTLPYYTADQLPTLLQDALATTEQQLVNLLTNQKMASNATDESNQLLRTQIEDIRRSRLYPMRPLAEWMPPSTGLAAGQTLSIPFKVRRLGNGVGSTKVVWKLVSEREYVRYEIAVGRADSKELRLVSDGPAENWTENPDGLVLHPWPNRTSEFRIGLVNEGAARVVNLEMLRLLQRGDIALPNGFVDASVSRDIGNRLGNIETLQTIPEVAIAENNLPYWLTLQSEKPVAVPAKASDAPPPPSIRHGLVLVLTDKTTGEKLWRKIDFRVRHPRSYVEPRIRYDAVSERVVIQLRPVAGQVVPATGINIHGECLSSLPGGMEKRLDGLMAGSNPLELICQVPPRVGRKVTMALDVDQFPRAFVFDVPCWETQTDIPLLMDRQRLSIIDPPPGLLIPGALDRQDVKLRVDAFPGAFSSDRDVIEIGWDLDRDREFAGESTTRLRSDRHVAVDLLPSKGERLVVKAHVKDVELTIPAPTVRAGNLNLLARMTSAGETIWSEPIEVIADDQKPTITGVELTPDVVVKQGDDLNLTIGAEDNSLSGLATVQLQVDRKLTGQWDAAGAAIDCTRSAEGSWLGVLPTADLIPGRTNVLVRATDRANNVSALGKAHFEILSVDQWQARQASAGLEVTGSISYSGGPLGGARVTLANDKGEIVHQTRANAQGIFQFPKVAAGKYKLVGTGVAKNRPRRSESDVEVKEIPATPLRLQLQAK